MLEVVVQGDGCDRGPGVHAQVARGHGVRGAYLNPSGRPDTCVTCVLRQGFVDRERDQRPAGHSVPDPNKIRFASFQFRGQ